MATVGSESQSGEHKIAINTNDLVDDLSKDYARYMEVEVSTETEQFADSIEEMLTRLDEYCGLVDIIRSDTSLCLNRTLPEIYKKTKEMEKVFERIDQLEAYVEMVKKTVNDMEKQVEKAESEMGTLSTFKKMFGSFSFSGFLGSKSTPKQSNPGQTTFDPPEIFNTKKHISYNTPHTTSRSNSGAPPSASKQDCSDSGKSGDVTKSTLSDTGTLDSGISVTSPSDKEPSPVGVDSPTSDHSTPHSLDASPAQDNSDV